MFKKMASGLLVLVSLSAVSCSDDDDRSDIEKLCDNIMESSDTFDADYHWVFLGEKVTYTDRYVCIRDQEKIRDIIDNSSDTNAACKNELKDFQHCLGKLDVSDLYGPDAMFEECESEQVAWNDCANTYYTAD